MNKNYTRIIISAAAVIALLAFLLVTSSVYSEKIFMNGELSSKHALLEKNCANCHTVWSSVTPETCNTCHNGMGHYDKTSNDPAIVEATATCSNCHKEHKGRSHNINHVEEANCRSCHEGSIHLGNVERGKVDLYFPHSTHSTLAIVNESTCKNCHESSGSGAVLSLTARYTDNCSTCHKLKRHGYEAKVFTGCNKCHPEGSFELLRQKARTKRAFSHAMHSNKDCVECHGEMTSKRIEARGEGADTLKWNGISRCSACHTREQINQGCTTCHNYHHT